MKIKTARTLLATCIAVSLGLPWADSGECATQVAGTGLTHVSAARVSKTGNSSYDEAVRRAYLKTIGYSEAEITSYIKKYNDEYFGYRSLGGVKYSVKVDGVDGVVATGVTDGKGEYKFDLPDQYQADWDAGKVKIQFTMDGPDRSNIVLPGGTQVQSAWRAIPPPASNGKIIFDPDSGGKDDERVVMCNTLYKSFEKIDKQSPKTSLIQHPKITIDQGESAADIKYLFGYVDIQIRTSDIIDVFTKDVFGFAYHEYGHFGLYDKIGGNYAVYLFSGGNHEMGGKLNSQKYAWNESYAHHVASRGVGVPKNLYYITDMEWINAEIGWEKKLQRVLAMPNSDPISKGAAKARLYNSFKTPNDHAEKKFAEIKDASNLNYYEGYGTVVLDELYFYKKDKSWQDEAARKIDYIIMLSSPGSADDFYFWWGVYYPGDSDLIQQIKARVRKRLIDDQEARIARNKALMENLHKSLYPPPPAPPEDPCENNTAEPGSGCGDVPGPILVPGSRPYTPAGLAVCPAKRVFFITDRTYGRIVMVLPDEVQHRSIPLVTGIDRLGAIDIADKGQSLVFEGSGYPKKTFFGVTAFVEDETGAPIGGAAVFVKSERGEYHGKTDPYGYCSVMDVLLPLLADRNVSLTIIYGGKTQEYRVRLEECQLFVPLVFNGKTATPLSSSVTVNVTPGTTTEVNLGITPPEEPGQTPPASPPGGGNSPPPSSPGEVPEKNDAGGGLAPPTVEIITPVNGTTTNVPEQILQGAVSDISILEARVSINGTETTIPVNNKKFNSAITLQSGVNTITVRATSVLQGSNPPQSAEGVSTPVQVTYDPAPAGNGTVYGVVVNSYTGNPKGNARVVAEGTGLETRTDKGGWYGFPQLPAGSVTLQATP